MQPKKYIVYRKCSAQGCENKSTNDPNNRITFFSFPHEPERITQWLKILQRTEYLNNLDKARKLKVCAAHFRPDMQVGKQLLKSAVPSLKKEKLKPSKIKPNEVRVGYISKENDPFYQPTKTKEKTKSCKNQELSKDTNTPPNVEKTKEKTKSCKNQKSSKDTNTPPNVVKTIYIKYPQPTKTKEKTKSCKNQESSKDTNTTNTPPNVEKTIYIKYPQVILRPDPANKRKQSDLPINLPDNTMLCEVCRRIVSSNDAANLSLELVTGQKLKLCNACEKNLKALKPATTRKRKADLSDHCSFCRNMTKKSNKHNPTNWHPNIQRIFHPSLMDRECIYICEICKININQLSARMWNVCRICAKTTISLIDILESDDILWKLNLFHGIMISSLNGLPNYICTVCSEELNRVAMFHEKISKSTERFSVIHFKSLISFECNNTDSNSYNHHENNPVNCNNPQSKGENVVNGPSIIPSETIEYPPPPKIANTSNFFEKTPAKLPRFENISNTFETTLEANTCEATIDTKNTCETTIDTTQYPAVQEFKLNGRVLGTLRIRSKSPSSIPKISPDIELLPKSDSEDNCFNGYMKTVSILSSEDDLKFNVMSDTILCDDNRSNCSVKFEESPENDFIVDEEYTVNTM